MRIQPASAARAAELHPLDGQVGYQDQVLATLASLRWELVATESDGDWWLDEQWTLRSTAESYDRVLYVTFVVDPMWTGNRKKGQGVVCIHASSQPLSSWNDKSSSVAQIWMSSRHFAAKLSDFRQAVQVYQRAAV